ncbi:FecR domain-containing protein [Dyadobacter sp. CY345]|uniref:FecR family protein n=1 Tax=Dyadobacter sp. CY345 TaxID=2909335 RepID=UPI001F406AB0|nr:FecR domain-containing protein [Dyadobacter sp. CY345]MCF2443569.1 FecR domain-containing protein [Dyadobacter sp. CY345]
MEAERIEYLTKKFFAGNCTEAEKLELSSWINQNPNDERIASLLEISWRDFEPKIEMSETSSDRILSNIFSQNEEAAFDDLSSRQTETRSLWPKIAAAAILILGFGLYFLIGSQKEQRLAADSTSKTINSDLPPGGNKAILTLGDGSNIVLDNAGNGNLATQGNTDILKSKNGELVYKHNNAEQEAIVFNSLTTPKGGQYHIVLPDGSKVWLNAASSLKFPTVFRGNERRVEITGEVYFEVAHNPKMPFIVKANDTEVAVLGTHFNVMAYPDEKSMRTTLLEGSVKVSKGGKSALLTPGQQARLNSNGINVLNNVNIEQEMAWKNGFFQFEDDNLETIMRQVSRWYDVDVACEGNVSRERFSGRLPRNANISKVLKILSLSGLKYKIEGKTITVTP